MLRAARRHDPGLASRDPAGLAPWIESRHIELYELARGGRELRPVYLQGSDARDQRIPRCAAHGRDRDLFDGTVTRKRIDGRAARAPVAMDRCRRDRCGARLSLRGHASRSARRRRLSVPRGVRPVGERHDDACLDRDCGAARRGGRNTVRHPRLSRPPRTPDHGADPRSHADGADLRLSRSDPVSLRLRAGRGADRDHDLCDAADGARDHDGARSRAARNRRIRHHGGHNRAADVVQGHASRRAAATSRRRQPGHHALAQHGDYRFDDRGRGPWL